MEAQFAPDARVRDAARGEELGAAEWVARQRVEGAAAVTLRRVVTQSNDVAAEIAVTRHGAQRSVAAFYLLRDGRIAAAVEYWAPQPPEPAPPAGG